MRTASLSSILGLLLLYSKNRLQKGNKVQLKVQMNSDAKDPWTTVPFNTIKNLDKLFTIMMMSWSDTSGDPLQCH